MLTKVQRIKQGSGKGRILFATFLYSTLNHGHIHILTLETHGCQIKLIASLINVSPEKSSRKNNRGQAVVKDFQVRRHIAANCMTDRANTVYCGHWTWLFPFLPWDFQSRWPALPLASVQPHIPLLHQEPQHLLLFLPPRQAFDQLAQVALLLKTEFINNCVGSRGSWKTGIFS